MPQPDSRPENHVETGGQWPGPALREKALTVDPAELELSRESVGGPVWGFVMDSAFSDSENWFSLVTFAEGTTSLYTNAAFGIIGGGGHPHVRAAGEQLLRIVADHVESFAADASTALPEAGMVTMHALTFDGPRAITAPEAELVAGSHPASSVFVAAHSVITALRVASGEEL